MSKRSSAGYSKDRLRSVVLGTVGNLAPGDQLDILVLQELAEGGAGEVIEVTLTPGGAPGVTFAGGGAHFFVVVGEVDDEFGYTRLHGLNGTLVEVGPFFWRDAGVDGNGVVDHYVIGVERFFKIWILLKPVASDKERQFVLVREAKRDFEEFLAGAIQAILMGIEVGGANAHGVGAIDLRA